MLRKLLGLGKKEAPKVVSGACRSCHGVNVEARSPDPLTMEIYCADCERVTFTFREREVVSQGNEPELFHVVFMVGKDHARTGCKPSRGDKPFSATTLHVTGREFTILMKEASQFLLMRAAELKDKR